MASKLLILVVSLIWFASGDQSGENSQKLGSPLHLAAIAGDVPQIRAALDAGHNVNEPFQDGSTPLHLAIYAKNMDAAKELIQRGANINAVTENKYTVLHTAVNSDAPAHIVEYLLEKGAEVDAADVDGNTPLMIAVKNQNIAVVKLLMSRGASDEIANNAGLTARDFLAKAAAPPKKEKKEPVGKKDPLKDPQFKENAKALKTKAVKEWSSDDVVFWLTTLGIPNKNIGTIQKTFTKLHIDGAKLVDLTEETLRSEFEMSVENSRTIAHAKDKLVQARGNSRGRHQEL